MLSVNMSERGARGKRMYAFVPITSTAARMMVRAVSTPAASQAHSTNQGRRAVYVAPVARYTERIRPLSSQPSHSRGNEVKFKSSDIPLPKLNDELTGTVTRIVPYGAFVDVSNGVRGLVHISEIADRYITSIHDHVKLGDTVNVRVIGVEGSPRKVSFSIRQSIAVQSKGYERVVELGGDWGHPWNDDGHTNYVEFSVPPVGPHHWEPDSTLFTHFDQDSKEPPLNTSSTDT